MAEEGERKEVIVKRVQLRTNFEWFLVEDRAKYDVFKDKVELFFECNEVPEGDQAKLFLNGIDQGVYDLIKKRIHPLTRRRSA